MLTHSMRVRGRWNRAIAAAVVLGLTAALVTVALAGDTAGTDWTRSELSDRSIAAPVRYGPTWLPTRYRERARAVSEGEVMRVWTTGQRPTTIDRGIELTLTVLEIDPESDGCVEYASAPDLRINGHPGKYRTAKGLGDLATVCWKPDPQTRLLLETRSRLGMDTLQRIARSVRPDASWVWLPIRPPPDFREVFGIGSSVDFAVIVGDSPTSWTATYTAHSLSKGNKRSVDFELSTSRPRPDSEGPDHVRKVGSGLWLSVDLWVYPSGSTGTAGAVISEYTMVNPRPHPWLGKRPVRPTRARRRTRARPRPARPGW